MEGALLIGDGPVRRLSVEEASAYDGPGFLWLHLEGRDEQDLAHCVSSSTPSIAHIGSTPAAV